MKPRGATHVGTHSLVVLYAEDGKRIVVITLRSLGIPNELWISAALPGPG